MTTWDIRMWWFIGGAVYGFVSPMGLPFHLVAAGFFVACAGIAYGRERAMIRAGLAT